MEAPFRGRGPGGFVLSPAEAGFLAMIFLLTPGLRLGLASFAR